jgi:molecular chaperone HscC
MIVGIDLGTTNSLVGVWRNGGAELVPNALGSFLTPSAISLDDRGEVLVGLAARERLSTAPDRSAAAFKRYMGTDRRFKLGGKTFRAEELSSLVLRSLKADAESFLGCEVGEAIVTVPAYFNDAQRKATKIAGELAGFKVERLLNEPTAAALAYGLQENEGDRKILVLDLGGGTFDVSILEMFEGVMEVRASAGDNFLGGEDFVDAIMDGFIAGVGAGARIPPRARPDDIHAPLRRQAEIAKRALSDRAQHDMELVHRSKTIRWTITRDAFETLSAPLLERMRAPIERALRDAKLPPDEVSHLVLAGGATRMPMFKQLAARLFRRLPISQIPPEEVVARGAAVQAGLKMRDAALNEVVMTDVAPFTLGVEVVTKYDGQIAATGVYRPIIERNTTIPASRSITLSTIQDGQRRVKVRVFQGEAHLVCDNIFLGEFSIAVPPAPAGEQKIDIRFTYDLSGLLDVQARSLGSGKTAELVIEGRPGAMSAAEVARRLASLAHLKIHPRDQTENKVALARAARLYEERLGDERHQIGQRIDRFRVIIDRQDPKEIAEFRSGFLRWLDGIDVTFFS